MKAKEGIIDLLNKILTADLTAINHISSTPRCARTGDMTVCTIRSKSAASMR